MNLVKSEFLKVLYARTYRWLVVGAVALAVLSSVASPYAVHALANETTLSQLNDPQMVSGMYAKAVGGYLIVVVMGVLLMAGEFRHHTSVATFLAAPRRASVLIAKLVVSVGVGIATMIISTGLGVVACAATLQMFPEAVAPAPGTFSHLAVIAVVTGAVLAAIGVAVGTLIRNQATAVSLVFVWMYLVERLLVLFWPTGGKYLPTGLITGMMALHLEGSDKATGLGLNTADYLSATPATFLLLGYGAVFAVLAIVTSLRRDID